MGFNRKLFDSKLYIPLTSMVNKTIYQNPSYKLVVTGKSAGGSLSILYGVYLTARVVPNSYNIYVYSLAYPRLSNDVFQSAIRKIPNLAIWELVYKRDLIPRLPAYSSGYRRLGHLIYWNGYNNVKAYYQTEGDSGKGYKGVDFGTGGSLDDHGQSKYNSAVSQSIADPTHYWPVAFEKIATPPPVSSPTAAPTPRRCCFYLFFCWYYC